MTTLPGKRPAGARSFRLVGAVLAGGEARRFGADKTAAEVGGVPMLERAVEALGGPCDEVVVVSSRAGTPGGPWRVIPDLRPGRGPLAGIEAALSALAKQASDGRATGAAGAGRRPDAVVVLAADMPFVGPLAVAQLVSAYDGADAGTLAVAAARKGDPPYEPLCAVYSLPCLPIAGRLLDQGRSAARDLFSEVAGVTVEIGGDAASVNVNTPADREAADARLREGTRPAAASSRSVRAGPSSKGAE
ncbi:MAG: molybdenum cofactor guanylyltransferase [Gemmatimonadetes bacterium]|nr:molybdenum cofactor guanylyltransferase [Gemmatimonadota bacterium]